MEEFDEMKLFPAVTKKEFEKVLAHINVKNRCLSCGHDKFFYSIESDGSEKLLVQRLVPLGDTNNYGLTVYVRACLRCGFIQHFSRALVEAIQEDLLAEKDHAG